MKKIKKTFTVFTIIISFFILSILGIYLYAKISPKLAIDGANGYYLYDNQGNLYNGTASKDWVNLKHISKNLINATISAEDKKFYKHKGFDLMRIGKALFTNISKGKTLQGASTITQQYSKNLFLDFGKTWKRKLKEAWLTIRLETHYSKNDILEGYLNTINYGGIFGIENAAQYYFNKSADNLSLAESTILASIPKNPSLYSPLISPKRSKQRQKSILKSMVKNHYISYKDMQKALNEQLSYQSGINNNDSKMIRYYEDAVMQELKSIKSIPESFLDTGGIKIYTNLDKNAQTTLEKNVTESITNNIQLAGVMVNPNNGKVLALTGGTNYNKSQFNRAINSKRQVGSTIKPFLYYAALENGFTPSTTFTSEKTTFTFAGNKTYSPSNFNNEYGNKEISMAAAIAYSDNIYAVKTHLFLGEDTLANMVKRVGISTKLEKIPSSALGSSEINLLDITRGYAVLANGGYKINTYFINKITDSKGNILYEHKNDKEEVLNENIVYILNELLTSTYAKELVDYNYPTCYSIASKITKKYAIKTGSTNTDNLIFGYNKDILVGLWNGYDNNKDVTNMDSANLKNIWVNTIEQYLQDKKDSWYKKPDNVVGIMVNPVTGKSANKDTKNAKIMYYIKGTEPDTSKSLDESVTAAKAN